MNGADVCILNQLLFLKNSKRILTHSLKHVSYCAPKPYQWHDLQKLFLEVNELNMQNNHCHMNSDCVCISVLVHSCTCLNMVSARAPSASGQVLFTLQQCFSSSSLQGQACMPVTVLSFPCYSQTGRPGESKEKLSFRKLAFMSFLFPELHWVASGLHLRWMLLSSSPAYRYPSLTSIQIPAILCQITCLFTSLYLPAHYHSLLLTTPFLLHYIMLMRHGFHLIFVIC